MVYLYWEMLCVALFWSVFCRAVLMDRTTRFDVRLSLVMLGTSALVGAVAPLYGWSPDWVTLTMVTAITVLQSVMATHWENKVPRHFVKPEHLPKRRVGDIT